MSEDASASDEAGVLDDEFGRQLGADLAGGDRRTRRWSRRRPAPADHPSDVVPPPPPPPSSSVPPSSVPPSSPLRPAAESEDVPAPLADATSPVSEAALALVALLTGGKAPGSDEALRLAALLTGGLPPEPAAPADQARQDDDPDLSGDDPARLDDRAEPAVVAPVDAPAARSEDLEPAVVAPLDDPARLDDMAEPAVVARIDAPAIPGEDLEVAAVAPVDAPAARSKDLELAVVAPFDDPAVPGEDLGLAAFLVGVDRTVLDEVTAVAPLPVAEEQPGGDAPPDLPPLLMAELVTAPAETSPPAMPPPPTGPRLAGPEDIPPPPLPDGQPGGNGDGVGEQAEHVDIFELFGWPPDPAGLGDDDVRSLHDTRPFPLPVGNQTAVYDLRALQFLDSGVPPGPDGSPGTERPPTGPDLPAESPARRRLAAPVETGDRVFRSGAWAGGLSVLVIMAVVGLFLTVQAFPALRTRGFRFLTTQEWQPDIQVFGIAAVLFYTVAIAAVALVVAVPLATGTALFITELAPRRLRSWFVAMVDLMAAVPSIVYGLWGLFFLQGRVIGLSRWLSVWLGWIPLFKVDGIDPSDPGASQSVFTASTFIAGIVVALMVIPISCSIMREVFSQAPPGEREGAFALGATRWGMMRTVVLPFGRAGMIGAIMLGLGRALGETIAVYLLISPVFDINWHVLQTGSNSVAALIVLRQGDASGFGLSALMAAGLALFIMTLIVNFGASAIVARSRSGALSEA